MENHWSEFPLEGRTGQTGETRNHFWPIGVACGESSRPPRRIKLEWPGPGLSHPRGLGRAPRWGYKRRSASNPSAQALVPLGPRIEREWKDFKRDLLTGERRVETPARNGESCNTAGNGMRCNTNRRRECVFEHSHVATRQASGGMKRAPRHLRPKGYEQGSEISTTIDR